MNWVLDCWVEKRYLRGLEVSAAVCLQQSRTACYVELLCWYVYVCLVRIEIYDNVMYIVHICTPAQAYIWDIVIESLSCDMMSKYWVIYETSWLIATLRCWVTRDWVAWQMRSTWVGRQVKQCHNNGLLGSTCWVVLCLDASLFECWKLLRNRLIVCELWIMNSVVVVARTMDVWNILELLICDTCRWLWIC